MDDWVVRAMQRWPNVPALFGWPALNRRGRWLIQGEVITHPLIVQTINRNYAADKQGRWYFQNGPQRGYMDLEYAPLVLHTDNDECMLVTHTSRGVASVTAAYLDEEGALVLQTEHGPGEVVSTDLSWMLARMQHEGAAVTDEQLSDALALSSGAPTALTLTINDQTVPIQRVDAADLPRTLGFIRNPQPREDERFSH